MTYEEIELCLPQGPFTKAGPWLYTHVVTKFKKRLWVTRYETGERIYTPPDFIQIHGRSDFDRMIDVLNRGAKLIDAMMAFESTAKVKKQYR